MEISRNNQLSNSITDQNLSHVCQVCGNENVRMAYGVLSCSPCKVFFRRNYQMDLRISHCIFGNACDVKMNNRHTCRYCRIKKCYAVGMQKVLIRASHTKQNKSIEQNNRSLTLTLPIDTLLHHDTSLLSTEQWTFLSNLINSYDERSPLPDIQKTIAASSNYPAKIRLKMATEHIQSITKNLFNSIGLLIKELPQFLNLSLNDQIILIERNIRTVGSIDGIHLMNETNLYQISYYYDSGVALYNSTFINQMLRVAHQSEKNGILFKLIVPVLLFSTTSDILDPTCHINNDPNDVPGGNRPFSHTLHLFNIQNFYVEILFKYMLYKYGYIEASVRFAQMIKTSLDQTLWLSNYTEFREHHQMVQIIANNIEQSLILNEEMIK